MCWQCAVGTRKAGTTATGIGVRSGANPARQYSASPKLTLGYALEPYLAYSTQPNPGSAQDWRNLIRQQSNFMRTFVESGNFQTRSLQACGGGSKVSLKFTTQ